MKNSFFYAAKTAVYLLLISGLFIACDNSTDSDHDDDQEQEPVGLRIKSFENETVGQTVIELSDGAVTGKISIEVDSTKQYVVIFLDEEGTEFQVDGREHSINFGQTNTNASIEIFQSTEFAFPSPFRVTGNSVGNAELKLTLFHEDAPELVSPGLPIEVTSSN
jgi:hypothetical protein